MTKTIIRIGIVLGIPLLIGILAYSMLKSFFLEPVSPSNNKMVLVEVTPGSSFRSFTKELHGKGIIKHWWVLDFLSQINKSDKQIQAGEYELAPSMTPREIIAKLAKGDVFKRIVTVKEGVNMWEVAAELEKADVISSREFLKAATDPDLLARMEINAPTIEGYLYPETYHFSGTPNAINVLWRFIDEFNKHWTADFNTKLEELNFSIQDVLTLASIIEKESGNVKEQPHVSSVFHNRLRLGMKLETDPTLVYGLKTFSGEINNSHKERDTPYNTYKYFGLPPGPIANPGTSAIKAALYPEKTDDLFFVADGNGGHVFSKTLKEHNKAVRVYRDLIRKRKAAAADAK